MNNEKSNRGAPSMDSRLPAQVVPLKDRDKSSPARSKVSIADSNHAKL